MSYKEAKLFHLCLDSIGFPKFGHNIYTFIHIYIYLDASNKVAGSEVSKLSQTSKLKIVTPHSNFMSKYGTINMQLCD